MKVELSIKKCVFFLVFALIFPVFARGRHELVRAGHWVYDALTQISLECGFTDFADRAPLSINELKIYLDEVDYDRLSECGKSQYERIVEYFNEETISVGPDIFKFKLEPEFNLEAYLKTNDDIGFVYDRFSRQPLVRFPAMFEIEKYFTIDLEAKLSQNKSRMEDNDNYTNLPLSPDDCDINFPDWAYFSTGYNFNDKVGIAFKFGIGEQSFSRSSTGSVVISEYFTNTTFTSLEVYSPYLRYFMMIDQMSPELYYYSHQFDVRVGKKKKFQISVMELIAVNEPLELRYLNPLCVYHGMAPWRDYNKARFDIDADGNLVVDTKTYDETTCNLFATKISFVPVNNLRLYGTLAFDQVQTPYERANWPDDVTPNAFAYQLGIEHFIPYREGRFRWNLEGIYTDPYMYIKQNPNWSLCHTFRESMGGMTNQYEWLGSPFGPDTIAAQLDFDYEVPEKWSVGLSYLFKAAGGFSGNNVFNPFLSWGGEDRVPNMTYWAYPDSDSQGLDEAKRRRDMSTPSGTANLVHRIALNGKLVPRPGLTLALQPAYVLSFNHRNISGNFEQGFEVALSANMRLSRFMKKNRELAASAVPEVSESMDQESEVSVSAE